MGGRRRQRAGKALIGNTVARIVLLLSSAQGYSQPSTGGGLTVKATDDVNPAAPWPQSSNSWTDKWHPQSDDDVVTIYVQIGKTGSSSFKHSLLSAADSAKASGEDFLCVIDNRPEDNYYLQESELKYRKSQCNGSAIVYGAGVQFGDCALVAPRRCQYLTLLREPGNRTISEYNYYCRGCAEKSPEGLGKFCGGYVDAGCPDISLAGWASSRANQYTQLFRKPWGASSKTNEQYYEQYYAGFPSHNVTASDADKAMKVLSGSAEDAPMLAVPLEQLTASWPKIAAWLGRPDFDLAPFEMHLNAHNPTDMDYAPTPNDMHDLRHSTNSFDYMIYHALASNHTQPKSAWPTV